MKREHPVFVTPEHFRMIIRQMEKKSIIYPLKSFTPEYMNGTTFKDVYAALCVEFLKNKMGVPAEETVRRVMLGKRKIITENGKEVVVSLDRINKTVTMNTNNNITTFVATNDKKDLLLEKLFDTQQQILDAVQQILREWRGEK